MLVIALLHSHNKPIRFGVLKSEVDGISQKVLTQTLRKLERDGLVTRMVYNEMPLRVEYHLTEMANDFVPIVYAFKKWAESHMHEILLQNMQYDKKDETA
jgi:DNA-binding HxlR family transcriptional regulator